MKVLVGNVFLAVGYGEELLIGCIELGWGGLMAQAVEMVLEGAAAASGGEIECGGFGANVFGPHNFVGEAVFEQAVLVDAGGVGESVGADDGFVGLDGHVHEARHEVASGHELGGVEVGGEAELGAGFDNHGDFFRRVELAARGLLAVAKGGVEDLYSVAHVWSFGG